MMRKRLTDTFFTAATLIAAVLFCLPATADQVTIRKGDLAVTGEALGFDGTYLRLFTEYGEVSLDYRDAECEGAACPELEDFVPTLRLSGAVRMSDVLVPALIEGYARAHNWRAVRRDIDDTQFEYDVTTADTGAPILRFRFHAGTTAQGFSDLLANDADAVLAIREVTPHETQLAYDAGLGRLTDPRRAQIVALDAIVPVVSPRRADAVISMDELAGLFTGEVSDWAELGREAAPVTRHALKSDLGLLDEFSKRVLEPADKTLSDDVVLHNDLMSMSRAVVADPGAIGLTAYDRYDTTKPIAIGGSCGLRADASLVGLKTEDYPLGRPLFMYMPTRRVAPELAAWRSWLFSADAQLIASRAGFVDRGVDPMPIAQQGDRITQAVLQAGPEVDLDVLQGMLDSLAKRERLTTTFRFTPGSTRLDAQSRSNLLQLARGVRDGDFDDVRLFLIGFSDGKGPASANATLSMARAQSVRRALANLLGGELPDNVNISVDAYGEALPIACDDTAWGRQTNRRVELWVERAN